MRDGIWMPFLLVAGLGSLACGTDLVVVVKGFQDEAGLAVLEVHDSTPHLVKDPPRVRRTAKIVSKGAVFQVPGIPESRYALIAYHDRNGNGKVDHGWNRMPQEPLAFSNGFRPGILAGMPDFHKLAIDVKSSVDTLELVVDEIRLFGGREGSSK